MLSEDWEHSEKLGTLTARLANLDRELLESGVYLPDSTVATSENEQEKVIEEVRVEAASEPLTETASPKVEFDLDAILLRIDELQAVMPELQEPVVSLQSQAEEAIPITPEVVSRFEHEAQAAQAMADLGRSLLSGGQMSLDAWLGAHKVDPLATKKNVPQKRKELTGNQTVQLTLF